MAAELQKQQSGTIETARILFRESQELELAGMLYLLGQQYRIDITPEVSRLWTLTLIERERLSGARIRESFLAWFSGERASFQPQPGDIIGLSHTLAPDQIERENETLKEMAELKRRAAAGEKFYGEADLWQYAAERGANRKIMKPMPPAEKPFPDIDPEKNRSKLEQQARELANYNFTGKETA